MTTSELIQKYNNVTTGLFRAGQNRGIGSDDYRAFVTDLVSTFATGAVDWTFADNSNNFPTASVQGQLYVALDDHGSPGDADYVQAGTWMLSKVAGANEFSEYYMKP